MSTFNYTIMIEIYMSKHLMLSVTIRICDFCGYITNFVNIRFYKSCDVTE